MRNRESIVGGKFGRLTVIAEAPATRTKTGTIKWFRCQCECGKEIVTRRYYLTKGETRSCGCLALEVRTKHGQASSPTRTYRAWRGIKDRCQNPNLPQWKDYGGRGIKVCVRWIDSFSNFLADMGEAPEGTSIDRINNAGNYEPGNCKWSTEAEQKRNTRRNRVFTVSGITACLTDLCSHFNVPRGTISTRLRRGWSVEESFAVPVGRYVRRNHEGLSV